MPADLGSKKRKREFSTSEADGRPLAKQVRSESPFIDAEDLPLDPSDAHKILTVLSTVDTDNFMDRIFSFQANPPAQTTLRSLLQESSKHPLRIIRGAVNQLLPSSSQPRALLAIGASNQQRFVDFAHGLLNQVAARGANTISSKRDTVVASDEERDAEILLPFEERKRKYALVQRLPSGDWWSSATIPREGAVGLNRAAAKQLVTKQAELVSIVPSQPVPPDEMPLFSTLKPLPVTKHKDDSKKPVTLPTRTLPAPKLLDYGVFCTFAPYFDSEGTEVGTNEIHCLVHESLQRRKARALRLQMLEKQKRLSQVEASTHKPAVDSVAGVADINESAVAALEIDEEMRAIDEEPQVSVESKTSVFPSDEVLQNLQKIMHRDETEIFKQALESLRAEFGVTELLEQTSIALDNLVRLRKNRILEGKSTPSELENQIAESITSSFSYLVSLRPRVASLPDDSVVPSAAALRTVHRAIPMEAVSGWRGTLASNRTTSLRDDATMYVKATAKAQAAAATAASSTVSTAQTNGAVRVPSTPTPATPGPQTSLYASNPMMYGYQHPGNFGYSTPSGPGSSHPTMSGPARVIPNMMNPKNPVSTTPGAPWPGYPGPMPPPYLGRMQPTTPLRTNASFK